MARGERIRREEVKYEDAMNKTLDAINHVMHITSVVIGGIYPSSILLLITRRAGPA